MSGVHGQVLHHLVRRGVQAVTSPDQQRIQQLQALAQSYEDAGPSGEVRPWEALPIIITMVVFMVMLASVRYTIGEVIATLAMIEQPKTTVVKGARYSLGDTDAPLEKERLIDEEVAIVKEDPITSNIRKTIKHLHTVGGFTARWRGLAVSMVYHMAHASIANLISGFVFGSFMFGMPSYIITSVLLSKLHMTWTHVMISKPSSKPWYKRIPSEKRVWKVLLLPSLVFAVAQQLTVALPIGAFFLTGLQRTNEATPRDPKIVLLRLLPVPAVAFLAAILILLPASVTLTRIEASLLPEEEETIVNFDRTFNGAFVGQIAIGATTTGKSLFIEAWRSFDYAARGRIIKLYVKMFFIQVGLLVVFVHFLAAEFFLMGSERLITLTSAGSAQLQLAAMGADQN